MAALGWKVGQTEQEINGWRVYRGELSMHLTQLANAGKRGKKVPVLTLWASVDGAIDTIACAVLVLIQESPDVATLSARLSEMAAVSGVGFESYEERGIDISPSEPSELVIRGDGVEVIASMTEFSVVDLRDTDNQTTLMQRSKVMARRFYAWAQQHTALLSSGSFSAVWNEMRAAGIAAHCFCAVD